MTTVWFSLRRRLLVLLLGGVTVAWSVSMIWSYIDVSHEVDELFDAQLIQATQTLLALTSTMEDNDVDELGEATRKYQRHLLFQIWRADGQLMLHSTNSPETPLTSTDGFTETAHEDGANWRYFSQWDKAHAYQVQVSENQLLREDLVRHIAQRLLLPALFGLPLIGFLVWLATRRSLTSLNSIAQLISRRDPQQLQALHPTTAPEEVRAMLDALNSLFRRVEIALEGERRFTADAAHELRTPLAALQAQLQVALRARDEDERNKSLAQLQSGLTRASLLVDKMLLLARLDPESGLPSPTLLDLSAVAASVCAELGGPILDKHLDFELLAADHCHVIGQSEWLCVLIRNLVDNAIRYTPAEGRVRVEIIRNEHSCLLRVTDSGPGIALEDRENVLNRFHRLNPSEQPGSGLGLAIVARIADLHGTSLHLSDARDGGLEASIELKNAPPP